MHTVKSLFIPHIFPNFTRNYVAESFSKIAEVERVDFVAKQDRYGNSYNAAYVHFNMWHPNHFANNILNNIYEKGNAQFYHDKSKYYWILLPNKAKKYIPGERKHCIDLGEVKSISVMKTPEKPVLKRNQNLDDKFLDELAEMAELNEIDEELRAELAMMDEIDAELDKEDKEDECLISIDGRYVQTIEQENVWLHGEVSRLRAALKAAKVSSVDL